LKQDYNMGSAVTDAKYNMANYHCYGVMGSLVLKGGPKDGQKIIKMRNPWGTHDYNGPWSEKDTNWTEDYRK
jgi:hypothetical protein